MIRSYIDVYNLLPRSPESKIIDLIRGITRGALPEFGEGRIDAEARLYGGWYSDKSLTKTAQLLSAALSGELPKMERYSLGDGKIYCKVSGYLAVALESRPRDIIHDTYREKSVDWRVKARSSEDFSCEESDCMLNLVRRTLRKRKCGYDQCGRDLGSILYRAEQKMVDTMMTCDLLANLNNKQDLIVVASDDSDFFPAVAMLLDAGVRVCWVASNDSHPQIKSVLSYPNFKFIPYIA